MHEGIKYKREGYNIFANNGNYVGVYNPETNEIEKEEDEEEEEEEDEEEEEEEEEDEDEEEEEEEEEDEDETPQVIQPRRVVFPTSENKEEKEEEEEEEDEDEEEDEEENNNNNEIKVVGTVKAANLNNKNKTNNSKYKGNWVHKGVKYTREGYNIFANNGNYIGEYNPKTNEINTSEVFTD